MKPLDGISVLVTRPQGQAEGIASAIEANGGIAVRAPMLVINKVGDQAEAFATMRKLESFDIAIFVSRNAADFGTQLIRGHDSWPLKAQVFASGPSTVRRLGELGVDDVEASSDEVGSEGLLRLRGLSKRCVESKKIIIFRGSRGREYLADTLKMRGAEVTYCECYERCKPDITLKPILEKNELEIPDIGLATSIELVENLAEVIVNERIDRLFNMPLMVASARIGRIVGSLGFNSSPLIVGNPTNENIITQLTTWATQKHDR